MKPIFTLSISLLLTIQSFAQGYQVTLQTPSFKSGIAYLAYRLGNNFNLEDSAIVNNKGVAIFKGNKTLPPGIYTIVFPGKNSTADFFINKEQQIKINADTTNILNMTVSGSKEHFLFQEYQKFVAKKAVFLQKEKNAYASATTKKDSAFHQANYSRYNTELNNYRDEIIKNHPNSMMAVLLMAMKEPPLPTKVAVTHQDSLDNYYYFKAHYWDGISFMDESIVRTPFFLPKLEQYYRNVISQNADSIIKDADYKLLLARSAPEMYKFLLNWLTDEYINPKYMGHDAIFVHLFEKYHSKGLSPWLNEKQMNAISRRAYMQMANLIGVNAANLEFIDTDNKPAPLYSVDADYTVMVFWDPTCGHCKTELPKIDSVWRSSWKSKNVKIYAVLTENKKEEWLKYIKENNITDWIHVRQTKEMEALDSAAQKPGFRQLYDVTITPTLYLLDKEKRIIGKKLSWQQLNDFLKQKWSDQKK